MDKINLHNVEDDMDSRYPEEQTSTSQLTSEVSPAPAGPAPAQPVSSSLVSSIPPPASGKSSFRCFTHTGALILLPPKAKKIDRLGDRAAHTEEEISSAYALLDLSQVSSKLPQIPPPPPPQVCKAKPKTKLKKSHGCGVCGKLFSWPYLLKVHLRTHTGEKPYGCAHCEKKFANRSNLHWHKQIHLSEKKYVCTQCHKAFVLKKYLKRHQKSTCVRDEDSPTGEPPASVS